MTYKFCVIDNGLYFEVARRLARDGHDVWYYCTAQGLYPSSKRLRIGEGFDGVHKVQHWLEVKDEPEICYVIPDVGFRFEALHLEELGKRVWGARMGEELELYREAAKAYMTKLGISVTPAHVVHGMDKLVDYLKSTDSQGTRFVKVEDNRGDTETFPVYSYAEQRLDLNQLRASLGVFDQDTKFLIEREIKDACEIGYDGIVIDGWTPAKTLFGIECKDLGYVGQVKPYEQIPAPLREINAKLKPTWKRQRFRSQFSSEVCVEKNGAYWFIDPTCRVPSPPGELVLEMMGNIAEVYYEGAAGEEIEPEWTAKFGAEIILRCKSADTDPTTVKVPPKYKDNVKLYFPARIGGETVVIPQGVGMAEIGAVVATGDTMESAIETCLKIAGELGGSKLEIPKGGVEDAQAEFDNLKAYGMAA